MGKSQKVNVRTARRFGCLARSLLWDGRATVSCNPQGARGGPEKLSPYQGARGYSLRSLKYLSTKLHVATTDTTGEASASLPSPSDWHLCRNQGDRGLHPGVPAESTKEGACWGRRRMLGQGHFLSLCQGSAWAAQEEETRLQPLCHLTRALSFAPAPCCAEGTEPSPITVTCPRHSMGVSLQGPLCLQGLMPLADRRAENWASSFSDTEQADTQGTAGWGALGVLMGSDAPSERPPLSSGRQQLRQRSSVILCVI